VAILKAELSLNLLVQRWLQIPIAGSVMLFLVGSRFYAYTVALLSIPLVTIVSTGPVWIAVDSRAIGDAAPFGKHHTNGKHVHLAAIFDADY
jgi:hypothetical protein